VGSFCYEGTTLPVLCPGTTYRYEYWYGYETIKKEIEEREGGGKGEG
jgi:hypothetical protein